MVTKNYGVPLQSIVELVDVAWPLVYVTEVWLSHVLFKSYFQVTAFSLIILLYLVEIDIKIVEKGLKELLKEIGNYSNHVLHFTTQVCRRNFSQERMLCVSNFMLFI